MDGLIALALAKKYSDSHGGVSSVNGITPDEYGNVELDLSVKQDAIITDAAGYFVTDTVEGALTQLGGERLTSSKTFYVASTGSDSTGTGTQDNPFATIQHALDILPKNLYGQTVKISLLDNVTLSKTSIRNFYGGFITIEGNTVIAYNVDHVFYINHSCVEFKLSNIISYGGRYTDSGAWNKGNCIFADNCSRVYINKACHFQRFSDDGTVGKIGLAIWSNRGSLVYTNWISNCEYSGFYSALYVCQAQFQSTDNPKHIINSSCGNGLNVVGVLQ